MAREPTTNREQKAADIQQNTNKKRRASRDGETLRSVLVLPEGLEPSTYGLRVDQLCSNNVETA
ncbi:MAG: hypothetical protein DWI22_19160 [Planctomycetota bacterium]|nr:MAG: hypothetical protein DWI22_19160 [Planctomycetota bacterium]